MTGVSLHSQAKSDSESILYLPSEKKSKKTNHLESARNIDFTY